MTRVYSCSLRAAILAAMAVACATTAQAQIRIGVNLSTTGPAAAIGSSSKNAILLWPKEIAGKKVEYIILDDATDPGNAVKNVRKLTTEEKVDIIVGPNTTPNALALLETVAETETPMVALAASASIVEPMDAKRAWVFKMPQNDTHMTTILTQHMADHGVKTVAFIGFADAYGEGWWREFSKLAELRHIRIVANERYARTDTSVTGQVLKMMAAKPDAVLIAGSGSPAVLPQKTLIERGYKSQIYQTHGIASLEFLKLGGKDVENTLFPTGPAVVARQLPEKNAVKKVSADFVQKYEAAYGANTITQFAGDAWGAYMLIANAVPVALKSAQPGSKAFRLALRAAIENTRELVVPQGIINMSATDHVGLDQRSRVMGKIEGGKFVYAYGG
ncbi:ABC transporter substrate-binding protein [Undibacterium sp. TJN19]|uniref:ABC transporter substrate-binding protein n=1 Tax=Undibacterium sp. TJN19 TaxID=3413055 RepID=UPI003BF0E492